MGLMGWSPVWIPKPQSQEHQHPRAGGRRHLSSSKESEFNFPLLVYSVWALKGYCDAPSHWRGSYAWLSSLVSFRNTLADTTRNNVSPAIQTSLSQVENKTNRQRVIFPVNYLGAVNSVLRIKSIFYFGEIPTYLLLGFKNYYLCSSRLVSVLLLEAQAVSNAPCLCHTPLVSLHYQFFEGPWFGLIKFIIHFIVTIN